jgi:hypothetical protein
MAPIVSLLYRPIKRFVTFRESTEVGYRGGSVEGLSSGLSRLGRRLR